MREILWHFDKTQVKLYPNFTSTPFDYLLVSWVTNYANNRGFWLVYCLKKFQPNVHYKLTRTISSVYLLIN